MLRILPLIAILVISITTQQTQGSYVETINYNRPPAASLFDASVIPTAAGACDLPGVMSVANQYTGATSSISADEGTNALGASVYDGYHVENSQNIPYTAMNTRGNSMNTAVAYPHSKGEILIHRPAPIIVKRPPTKVVVNHPPLVVKPAPVVLHKPPSVVVRRVYVKQHPRPVKVEPVYVNVVKPPAEKYYVNEKQQQQQQQQQHQQHQHQHQQQYHLEAQPSVAYASINPDGAAANAAAAPFSIANDASSYTTFSLTNPEPHRLSATGAMLSYDAPRSVFPSNYNASPSY